MLPTHKFHLPGASLEVTRGGHFFCLERPGEFRDVVHGFLSGLDA